MFAYTNLPGSSYFETYGPATKKECEEWLDEKAEEHKQRSGGNWWSTYGPGTIITNAEAKAMRWQDGSRVFSEFDSEY